MRAGNQGVGTGWVVDAPRRLLVTNLHVVGDRRDVEAFFPAFRDGHLIPERDYYIQNQKLLRERGLLVGGKVLARREASDLALVELERLPEGTKALPLASAPPRPGEAVHSVGQRHDVEALWVYSGGSVRQLGRLEEGYFWRGKRLAAGVRCVLAQSPINEGDSGGPLVNGRGEVVAVLAAVRWQVPLVSVGIDVSEVRALLDQVDTPPPEKPESPPATPEEPGRAVYPRVLRATAWVRPSATEGRAAGWVVDAGAKLLVTSSRAAGPADVVDVIFPCFRGERLVGEVSGYRDEIGLIRKGHRVRGVVLARDPIRDLALIQLESLPERTAALMLAEAAPRPGDCVHTVGHPTGLELLWLYAAGRVRQSARIRLAEGQEEERLLVHVLQLPAQGGPGGAVVNDAGQVVGVLAAKEGPQQQVSYAVSAAELRTFLRSAEPLWKPRSAEEYHRRGKLLLQRGWCEPAREAFASVVRLAPQDPAARRDLAEALRRRGQLRAALGQAERAVALEPKSPLGYVRRAAVRIDLGSLPEAIADCEKALRLDPKCAAAFDCRGEARRRLGKAKDALDDLDEALWLDPNLASAYWHRGLLREAAGDLDKALADVSRAFELDPSLVPALRMRAALHLRQREPKRAAADYARLVELTPLDADARLRLGRAWLAANDEAKALPALADALRLNPKRIGEVWRCLRRMNQE